MAPGIKPSKESEGSTAQSPRIRRWVGATAAAGLTFAALGLPRLAGCNAKVPLDTAAPLPASPPNIEQVARVDSPSVSELPPDRLHDQLIAIRDAVSNLGERRSVAAALAPYDPMLTISFVTQQVVRPTGFESSTNWVPREDYDHSVRAANPQVQALFENFPTSIPGVAHVEKLPVPGFTHVLLRWRDVHAHPLTGEVSPLSVQVQANTIESKISLDPWYLLPSGAAEGMSPSGALGWSSSMSRLHDVEKRLLDLQRGGATQLASTRQIVSQVGDLLADREGAFFQLSRAGRLTLIPSESEEWCNFVRGQIEGIRGQLRAKRFDEAHAATRYFLSDEVQKPRERAAVEMLAAGVIAGAFPSPLVPLQFGAYHDFAQAVAAPCAGGITFALIDLTPEAIRGQGPGMARDAYFQELLLGGVVDQRLVVRAQYVVSSAYPADLQVEAIAAQLRARGTSLPAELEREIRDKVARLRARNGLPVEGL